MDLHTNEITGSGWPVGYAGCYEVRKSSRKTTNKRIQYILVVWWLWCVEDRYSNCRLFFTRVLILMIRIVVHQKCV